MTYTDDQRNQLAELQHEACEHHCADCGRCDWESCNPPGATRDVPMIEVDGEMFCPDCSPDLADALLDAVETTGRVSAPWLRP